VTDRSSLEQRLVREVVGPHDANGPPPAPPWNLAVDQHPALVVVADGPEDVAATLGYSAEHGLRVAPQGTGLGASSMPALDETILLMEGFSGGSGSRVASAIRAKRKSVSGDGQLLPCMECHEGGPPGRLSVVV
jgi:hypothetical protein